VAAYTDHLYCETYPYVTPEELISCCSEAEGMGEDDPRITDAIDDASLVLYYLTGKQFSGTCRRTVRPGCLSGFCSCGCGPNQVNIGLWPVTNLVSVRYDGTLYTEAEADALFHVNEYHYLARNDGEAFLTGNQWAIAGGEEDTEDNGNVFEVTVDYGLSVPRLLTRAARALACQFVNACCGGDGCKLPERVTSIVRVGVTQEIASVVDLLEKGRTGVYEVDLAIKVFNPSNLQSPSFVWSPDRPGGRRINT
jgi:hypothetical protein